MYTHPYGYTYAYKHLQETDPTNHKIDEVTTCCVLLSTAGAAEPMAPPKVSSAATLMKERQ